MCAKPAIMMLFGLLAGASSMVSAQGISVTPEYARSVLRSTAIHIDGKSEPDRVPLSLRMKLFFYRYRINDTAGYQVELAKQLSIADKQVLDDYAVWHRQLIQQDEIEFKDHSDAIIMNSEGQSAIEVAEQFQEQFQKRQSKALARYGKVLASLSPEGRVIVERFAYEHVRPRVTINMPIDIAKVAPGMFLADVADRRLELIRGDQNAPAIKPESQHAEPSVLDDEDDAALFQPNPPPAE
jgi:hypothetical protein